MATEVKSGEETAGNSLEGIKKAVNDRLATCDSVVIDGKPFGIEVDFKEKPAEVVKEGQEGQGPEKKGGKRNKRKTRSKRSARKSHKSRRVFGGKRK